MALSPILQAKIIINKLWDKVWSTIKDHTFTVSVDNQVVIPEIKFPKTEFPEMPKPIDTRTELQEIVKTITKQTQELKVSPDTSATKEQLLNILNEIKGVLTKDKKDLTPDLIAGIGALQDELKTISNEIPKTDLKPIQSQIEALIGVLDFKSLKKFTRYDDIKVFINERQMEKLMKAMHVSVGVGGGGGSGLVTNAGGTVTPINPLDVNLNGHLCEENSTSDNITGAGTFVGDWMDTLDYNFIIIGMNTDKASATDGLAIQWSANASTVHDTDVFTIAAGGAKVFTFSPARQYFRINYTNGADTTTAFNIQTVMKKQGSKSSSHRLQDAIVDEDDAELIKAVLSAKFNGGGYGNISATADGNLKVANVEDGLSIAKGDVTGTSFIHKFGAAPDFDVHDGFVTVWDGAEDGEDYEAMQMTYSTTADIDYAVAENNGDTQDVEIQGLDTNYNLTVQTITLTGQTPAALTTALIRVFRVKNMNSSNFADHVFVYRARLGDGTPTVVTDGVPQTGADVRAVVHSDNNQTEMAVFTIPNGKTGYMRSWYASTAGAKRDSAHTIKVLARPFGKVFQLKHKANIDVNGTSYIQHKYIEPEVFAAKTDIEIQMDTDTDIAGVAAGFDIVLVDD